MLYIYVCVCIHVRKKNYELSDEPVSVADELSVEAPVSDAVAAFGGGAAGAEAGTAAGAAGIPAGTAAGTAAWASPPITGGVGVAAGTLERYFET